MLFSLQKDENIIFHTKIKDMAEEFVWYISK